MDKFSSICQNCGSGLMIKTLACKHCGVSVESDILLPKLARLDAEEREFVEVFVKSGGSLKKAGNILGISYPTVRTRLDRVITRLEQLDAIYSQERLAVLEQLEAGKISAKDAVEMLNKIKQR